VGGWLFWRLGFYGFQGMGWLVGGYLDLSFSSLVLLFSPKNKTCSFGICSLSFRGDTIKS